MQAGFRFEHVIATCALLIALGIARTGYRHLLKERGGEFDWERSPSIESLYLRVAHAIPPGARVGYLSTKPVSVDVADSPYVKATYTYAPRIVVRGTQGVDVIVATFSDRPALEELCVQHGLEAVVVDDAGIAVLRHKAAR